MTELSPTAAAHAVYDAAMYTPENATYRQIIAAALRAAADQVCHEWDGMECVDHLIAIAAELEGGND